MVDVLKVLSEVEQEIFDRPLTILKPRTVCLELEMHEMPLLPPPGTLVVYYGASDFVEFDELEGALVRGDRGILGMLHQRAESFRQGQPETRTDLEILEEVREAPLLFSVRYKRRTLTERAGLNHGQSFGTLTFPFVGLQLDPAEFEVVEHRRVSGEVMYRYLVAYRPPRLTDLERRVLERIPTDIVDITIAPSTSSDTFKQVADIVEKAARDALAEKHARTGGCPDLRLDRFDSRLREHDLNPYASVQELVRARRELMARSFD
ncbi:MAG: hypothetical protein M3326_12785 [Actinomycetota bacterium]|nr:hypothetical protein [Actinomycetota bacterium]MDQ3898093.1 hypothetical protein [Actinomycetota bacterium]